MRCCLSFTHTHTDTKQPVQNGSCWECEDGYDDDIFLMSLGTSAIRCLTLTSSTTSQVTISLFSYRGSNCNTNTNTLNIHFGNNTGNADIEENEQIYALTKCAIKHFISQQKLTNDEGYQATFNRLACMHIHEGESIEIHRITQFWCAVKDV